MNRLTRKSENNAIHDYEPTEYGNDLDRIDLLGEYEDLEEQGLLIKLPCKVDDFVFEANINRNIVSSYIVTAIVVGKNSRNYKWGLLDGIYSNMDGFNEFALGKSVFLTREEAEKALEGVEK